MRLDGSLGETIEEDQRLPERAAREQALLPATGHRVGPHQERHVLESGAKRLFGLVQLGSARLDREHQLHDDEQREAHHLGAHVDRLAGGGANSPALEARGDDLRHLRGQIVEAGGIELRAKPSPFHIRFITSESRNAAPTSDGSVISHVFFDRMSIRLTRLPASRPPSIV